MKRILVVTILCAVTSAYGDLTNGLVAYYKLNGNADDSSGNSKNGSVVGAHPTTNRFGEINGAYSFQNSGEYVVVTNSLHPLGDVSLTYSFWATWPTPTSIAQSVINVASVGGDGMFPRNSRSCVGFLDASGPFIFYCAEYNDAWFRDWPHFPAGEWHQVIVTKNGNEVNLYIDGEFNGQLAISSGQNVTSDTLYIGYNGSVTHVQGEQFFGSLSDVRIYNRPLSASEAKELYQAERGPLVHFVKAFTLDYSGLAIGTNYQLQASTDLSTWTNWGSVFTATNTSHTNTSYQRIDEWGRLMFRLQRAP
jgi:hypothetical protein